jgi:hypothetical protein
MKLILKTAACFLLLGVATTQLAMAKPTKIDLSDYIGVYNSSTLGCGFELKAVGFDNKITLTSIIPPRVENPESVDCKGYYQRCNGSTWTLKCDLTDGTCYDVLDQNKNACNQRPPTVVQLHKDGSFTTLAKDGAVFDFAGNRKGWKCPKY